MQSLLSLKKALNMPQFARRIIHLILISGAIFLLSCADEESPPSSENTAPTAILLSANSVAENSASGTLIGTLSAVDTPGDTHSYRFVAPNAVDPNIDAEGRFRIEGTQLKVADGSLLDYESNQSHTIQVEVIDQGGLRFSTGLVIMVTDVLDTLTATNTNLAETYNENTAASLTKITVTGPAPINATLTLSDVNAGTLSTGTVGNVSSTFVSGVWSASGPVSEVNSLLANVQFIPATGYKQNFFITVTISDAIRPDIHGIKTFTVNADLGAGFNQARGFNDLVYTIAEAKDGSGDVYVGGEFITYNNTTVNHMVRLNSDGSVDSGFDANLLAANDMVTHIVAAEDGSGDVYVASVFRTSIGTLDYRFARLNSDGSIDSGFDRQDFSIKVEVIALATDGSGDIYLAGPETFASGNISYLVQRFNSDGSVDSAFDYSGGANYYITAIAPAQDGSGNVYVGGNFSNFKGTAVNNLVRLNSDGSVDSGFDLSSGGANDLVSAIAPAADGDVYVGGNFTQFNAISNNRVVRLNSDGSVDSGFNLGAGGANSKVAAVALATDGSGDIYVGGSFTYYNATAVNRIARVNSDGSLDSGFDFSAGGVNDSVLAIAPASDGSADVYVGGQFTEYKNHSVKYLMRLNSDASLDGGFDYSRNGVTGVVYSIIAAKDGSGDLYAAGELTRYNDTTIAHLMRLHANGILNTGFDSGPGSSTFLWVRSIALAEDDSGDLYVGREFVAPNTYDTPEGHLVRLNSDGSLDSGFNYASGGSKATVHALAPALDGSGDVYLGGYPPFNFPGINKIVRLNSDGSEDNGFDLSAGGPSASLPPTVRAIAPAADGSGDIYVGGNFTSYNGVATGTLVRLNSDGSVDSGFDISGGGMSGTVNTIVMAADGSGDVYVGGSISRFNGVSLGCCLVRINNDGGIDTGFDMSGGNANNTVTTISLAQDSSGDIYVGGSFTSFKNTPVNYLVRLNNDGSIDSGFDYTKGFANHGVLSIAPALDGSGDVFVGGTFSSFNGTTTGPLVRLNADGSVN